MFFYKTATDTYQQLDFFDYCALQILLLIYLITYLLISFFFDIYLWQFNG